MAGMFEKPRPWWHGANVSRVVIGLLFLLAGVLKLVDLNAFHRDVLAYQILLKQPSGWIALILPVGEVLIGLSLIVGMLRSGCYAAVAFLSVVFGFIHIYALQRKLDVSCGCFGSLSLNSAVMLAINVLLFFIAIWLMKDDVRRNVIEKPKYHISPDLWKKKR